MRCVRAGRRIVAVMRTHLVRLVRLTFPGGNPISRGVDRIEGCSRLCVVLFGLALVPIMLMVGSLTYSDAVAASEQRTKSRHQVVATLLEDPPRGAAGESGADTGSRVPASWRSPGGSRRMGRVEAAADLVAGAEVRIWVDLDGRLVSRPVTRSEAAVAGVLAAVVGWLVAVGVLGFVHAVIKRLLDGRRSRAWAREWSRVEPRWRTDSG
jgi:hypothetical protein